jgi:hypothetical protein
MTNSHQLDCPHLLSPDFGLLYTFAWGVEATSRLEGGVPTSPTFSRRCAVLVRMTYGSVPPCVRSLGGCLHLACGISKTVSFDLVTRRAVVTVASVLRKTVSLSSYGGACGRRCDGGLSISRTTQLLHAFCDLTQMVQ